MRQVLMECIKVGPRRDVQRISAFVAANEKKMRGQKNHEFPITSMTRRLRELLTEQKE